MKIKVSVVMPTYNMKDYVATAIESWLAQSIDDKELICVDDCSTDGTLDILKEYEKKYDNIVVSSMDYNQGAGHVRNKAMELVKGEYISFLDADDKYWNANSLEILYNMAKDGDCDVVGGLLRDFNEINIMDYPRFRDLFNNSGDEYKDLCYQDFQDDYFFQGFLFRMEYIKKHKIEFPPFRRNQDPPFLVKALYFANRIRAVNVEFYGHKVGYKEIDYTVEKVTDLLNGFIMNLEFAIEYNLDKLFSKTINRLNTEYLAVLRKGLQLCDRNFVERLFYADRLATKFGKEITLVEYLFYLERNSNRLDQFKEFNTVQKLCEYLSQKDRVILYGAGYIGQNILYSIDRNNICDVIMWIDRYKAGNILGKRKLRGLDDIRNFSEEYDCIVIGLDNSEISRQVKADLVSCGVPENKIIEWVEFRW